MDITLYYTEIMSIISPVLTLSGMIAFTIAVIVMLVNMLIDAFTGKGFRIGRDK